MLMQADWPGSGREAFRTRNDDANTVAQACNAQHTQRHAGAVAVRVEGATFRTHKMGARFEHVLSIDVTTGCKSLLRCWPSACRD